MRNQGPFGRRQPICFQPDRFGFGPTGPMPARANIIDKQGSAGAENPQGMLVAVHTAKISSEPGDKSRRKSKNNGNKIFAPKAASLRADPVAHGSNVSRILPGKT